MKALRSAEFRSKLKIMKKALLSFALAIPLFAEAAFAQTTPQAAIADAAAEYGLGRPRGESLQPLQTPAPHNQGWWQAFERGWVYWHPRYGARVVKGKIFEAWGGQRWEQGAMGFPNGSETNCPPPDAHDSYQSFEGGKIYWNAATNRATVFTSAERFGADGKCFAPAHRRFRVTINGFTCNRQTVDLPSQYPDGMDDEVFVESKNFIFERRDGTAVASGSGGWSTRTFFYGDTAGGNFRQRTQAGSGRRLGANGGFRAGDSYPESPQKHSIDSQQNGLPLLLWEGTLTRRQNAAVFIPTIWETDSSTQPLYAPWTRTEISDNSGFVLGRLIENSNSSDQETAKSNIRNDFIQRVFVSLRDISHPLDRPIGMREYGGGDYRFRPEVFILTYDEARRMVERSQEKNGEAFPVTYRDADWLGGDYTLYLQVEQLAD